MKMYYYHTRPIQEALDEWKNHLHPGHILYGLTHFSKHGIHPILHHYRHFASRIRFSLYNFFEIIRCKEPYDLLYGTSFYGLAYYLLTCVRIVPQTHCYLAPSSRSPKLQQTEEFGFPLLL